MHSYLHHLENVTTQHVEYTLCDFLVLPVVPEQLISVFEQMEHPVIELKLATNDHLKWRVSVDFWQISI